MQIKEIANKMIVCNLHRHLQFLIVKVFYRAKNSKTILHRRRIISSG
jgi:hypothetical protein